MKNDLENEVNEKKKINISNTRPISERLTLELFGQSLAKV